MSQLDKAEELYLRGFNSKYIKRRTGISMQSLLKQLFAKGIRHSKQDVVNYQVEYISKKYTSDEIRDGYRSIIRNYQNPYDIRKGRHIEVLGCGFGDYIHVFKKLLGDAEYNKLRNECWHDKQSVVMQERYGVSNIFQKETFSQFVTEEAVREGRKKRTVTMLEKYGVERPNQNVDILATMEKHKTETMLQKYGVVSPMQVSNIAKKSAKHRQQAMLEKYGVANSVQLPEIRDKIFESRRKNHTLNTSVPEQVLHKMLVDYFGEDDVASNIIVDDRYPYHVDFYIKSLDLFIELNGDICHNNHWFDNANLRDLQILQSWRENAERIEKSTGKTSKYTKYIKTWTQTDIEKRETARKNKLHYLVFWDGSCRCKNKRSVPNLIDARAWFADGCPMPEQWHQENSY